MKKGRAEGRRFVLWACPHRVIGRKSPASLESKVLLYKTITKAICTYGFELWGCANKSHIAKMQRSQSKVLRMITNAPLHVTNQTVHDDLKVPFIKAVIQEKSINHRDKLGNHSNPILPTTTGRTTRNFGQQPN
jgi:hypothetical protein